MFIYSENGIQFLLQNRNYYFNKKKLKRQKLNKYCIILNNNKKIILGILIFQT